MMSGTEGEGNRKGKRRLMSHLHTVKAKRRFQGWLVIYWGRPRPGVGVGWRGAQGRTRKRPSNRKYAIIGQYCVMGMRMGMALFLIFRYTLCMPLASGRAPELGRDPNVTIAPRLKRETNTSLKKYVHKTIYKVSRANACLWNHIMPASHQDSISF